MRVVEDRQQKRMLGLELVRGIPTQRGGQVEAEAVHLQVVRPVPERVEDEPLGGGRRGIHGVAASGHIDVGTVGGLAVVVLVVDAAQARGGTAEALLRRVVVDHIEDHLEPGFVQQLDHALELAQHGTGAAELGLARRIGGVRGEEVEGVVAPVVGEPLLDQALLAHELVDRQKLHRGDAEILEVADRRLVGEARVGAAQLVGQVGVELGDALRVSLVDHGVIHADARLLRGAPVEGVGLLHVAAPLAARRAGQPPRVGVEQVQARVERVPSSRRTVGPDRVPRARGEQLRGHGPDVTVGLGQRQGGGDPARILVVEDAQIHRRRAGRPDAQHAAVGCEAHTEVGEGIGHAF